MSAINTISTLNDSTLGGLFAEVPSTPAPERYQRLAAARAAADAGMKQAAENAHPDFMDAARAALVRAAGRLAELTTDDVWAELEAAGMADATHNPSALGPVMKWGAGQGLIAFAQKYRQSERESRHCNQLRVWNSLLIADGGAK